MKNLKNVVAALTLTCVFTTLSVSGVAAESLKDDAKQTLKQYLSALKRKDAKTASALSVDLRVSGDEQETLVLNEKFQDPNLAIKSYDLLDKRVNTNDNEVTLVASIEYLNKRIEETPIKLKKSNMGWYVSIDGDKPNPELYKLVNEGAQISNDKTVTASALTTWSKTLNGDGGTTRFYTSNFNVTGSKVTINERQYTEYPIDPNLEYAIVTWGYVWDDVWASASISMDNPSYGYQFPLMCGARSNVCLRVKWLNIHTTCSVTSYGEVYNY